MRGGSSAWVSKMPGSWFLLGVNHVFLQKVSDSYKAGRNPENKENWGSCLLCDKRASTTL